MRTINIVVLPSRNLLLPKPEKNASYILSTPSAHANTPAVRVGALPRPSISSFIHLLVIVTLQISNAINITTAIKIHKKQHRQDNHGNKKRKLKYVPKVHRQYYYDNQKEHTYTPTKTAPRSRQQKNRTKMTIGIITATAKQPKNKIKFHHQNHRGKQ